MIKPLVSVDMITYNHAPYIAKAIECVLAQKTSFPFELVIGEDCSTDGTREIVLDYARRFPEKIRVITSDRNVGMKENSNRVYAALRGKYIAWCEGDDYWHSEGKLQLQVDYLESHPDCGLICSDYNQHDTKTGKTTINYFMNSGRAVVESPGINDILSGNGGILTCTVVARRELINRVKTEDPFLHQSGHFKMGDIQLWAELSLYAKVHRIENSLATRNLLQESASQSKDISRSLRFWLSNSEMCVYLCDKHNLPKQIRDNHIRNFRRNSLRLACYEGNRQLAESVRKTYPGFSIKDILWYYATGSIAMRYLMSRVLEIRLK
jgi:glycosyltransferase involved in cell wall biosynthesis